MKKIMLVVLAVLMLSFVAVSAQETEVEEKSLNFSTIGEMISWTTSAEEIYNMLGEYENLEITVEDNEEYGKYQHKPDFATEWFVFQQTECLVAFAGDEGFAASSAR